MAGTSSQAPTIQRGEFYGGDEGLQSAVTDASGSQIAGGGSPVFPILAAILVLVVIRLVWEMAD